MKTISSLLAGLGLALAGATASAGTLGFAPANTTVFPTNVFNVNVVGTGFAETIVGGGFNLSFDASVLELLSVSIAPAWEFAPSGGTINNAAGTLTDASFNSFVAPLAGNFTVATLTFRADAEGVSPLTLLPSAIFVWADTAANEVTPTYGIGSVAAIPEPTSVAMMLAGGLLMGALVRRRSHDQA